MEMEEQGRNDDTAHDKVVNKDKSKDTGKLKSSTHKSGGKSLIPLGLNKKAQFLRRGSPKPHRSSSREIIQSGKQYMGGVKSMKRVNRKGDGKEGSTNSSTNHP